MEPRSMLIDPRKPAVWLWWCNGESQQACSLLPLKFRTASVFWLWDWDLSCSAHSALGTSWLPARLDSAPLLWTSPLEFELSVATAKWCQVRAALTFELSWQVSKIWNGQLPSLGGCLIHKSHQSLQFGVFTDLFFYGGLWVCQSLFYVCMIEPPLPCHTLRLREEKYPLPYSSFGLRSFCSLSMWT